jgi:hypothetical protein
MLCYFLFILILFFVYYEWKRERMEGSITAPTFPLTALDGTICLAMSRNARRSLHPFYLVMCIQYERLFFYFMNICMCIYIYICLFVRTINPIFYINNE